MKTLSIEKMENLSGGTVCFGFAVIHDQMWDAFQNDPSEENFLYWAASFAALVHCTTSYQ
ncbi:hypothetical protein [Aquiflexum sp.]|uniref:hypothetical protein n=1 Tax=Aquiflexum sp. TaxID=1872584 RepID=UPI003594411C